MEKRYSESLGILFVIIAGVLWGTTGIYVRYFTSIGLSSLQITVFKIFLAAVFMLIICLIKDKSALKINIKDIWVFACAGFISLDFFTICYFKTIQSTSLSIAATLLYLAPSIVMILSIIIFKEKFEIKKVIACILAFLGCFFVSGYIGSGISISLSALGTGLLSAFGYALYSIFGQIAINKGYKSMTITTYTFIFASIGSLFFLRPSEIAVAISKASTLEFILMIIAISVAVSLLPYFFYTNGLERISPSKASIIASIEPVTATIVGVAFFKEYPDIYGIVGIGLVLFAIVLLNTHFGRKKYMEN